MRRVVEYRTLFNITKDADLAELKIIYRNLMKEWHPDKFVDNEEQREAAEVKSKQIIEAYHFLVSVSPETNKSNLEDYTNTTTNSGIDDIEYKGTTLKVSFTDGSVYEYLSIPKTVYNKLMNSSTLTRFARRHIFHEYMYRNVSKPKPVLAV
ncbi:MAG: KTSC domain-containing protein [Bacteroidota bacterium]|nr:KTSC domain-containing protein [Bacteroidota bacterium]